MPNGGPDCCGACDFNKAVQEMGRHPEDNKRFLALSNCTLRDLKITNPFWTYCHSFRWGELLPVPIVKEEAKGWVFASGLYEGYVRIPWHGMVEPKVSAPCICEICARKTQGGITVVHDGRTIGFCTNRHYIEWWKTMYNDPSLTLDQLATAEEYDKEKK
jgi:hypothetical protein